MGDGARPSGRRISVCWRRSRWGWISSGCCWSRSRAARPEVVATLLGAVDLVLLRPPMAPSAVQVRRLTAHARRHGAVLVTTSPWEGAQERLQAASSLWTGLSDGHGHLRGRRVQVVVRGKGPPRGAWLWLPGPDGRVGPADLVPVEEAA